MCSTPRAPLSLYSKAASPGNDLGEINKYVNVYFLLNLKAASIKIFDFWTLFSWKKEGKNEDGVKSDYPVIDRLSGAFLFAGLLWKAKLSINPVSSLHN